MQIVDNSALLLKTKKYDQIKQLIPKSRIIKKNSGVGEVLVYWGYNESKVLKNLNIKNVPSPILRNYTFPGFYKPFRHQLLTSSFLSLNQRCFCFNETGTGKTSSVVWAADYLMK